MVGNEETVPPVVGDVTLCVTCGAVLCYTEGMTLCALTEAEFHNLSPTLQMFVLNAQRVIQMAKAKLN